MPLPQDAPTATPTSGPPPAAAPVIELTGVSKIFRGKGLETLALRSVDLRIAAGEYVAVSGPSGCGKSTLLSIMGLLDVPTDGAYRLDGEPMVGLGQSERARIRNQRIGFIFQNFNLIADLTVAENVGLPLSYRDAPAAERRERVARALEIVGLSDRADYYPTQLSGGQQQRTSVARAWITNPSIVLADEPTGNLDSTHGHAMMELLNELHQLGATICLVSHDPRYVEYAERHVALLDGVVVADSAAV